MLWGWGAVGVAYGVSSQLRGSGHVLTETALDRLIAFNLHAVWGYLAFFVLIPWAYVAADASRLAWLRRAMQCCAAVAALLFVLYPTTLRYPLVPEHGISAAMLRLLQAVDSAKNCLPSLHGALTLLAVWALQDKRRPLRSALAVLLGVLICASVIALRRHLSVDLLAGLLLGGVCGAVCWRFAWPWSFTQEAQEATA
jgi:membrane-associated phospholipid phosphatase